MEEREKEIKKQIEEKDKKITDLTNKSEKENNNYIKKIRDLSNQLNAANSELNDLKNKNSAVALDEMLDDLRLYWKISLMHVKSKLKN